MFATEMNGMATIQVFFFEGRYRDASGIQCIEGRLQSFEVCCVGSDDDIAIATKLGRAVEHAGLTAHKQVLNLVGGKRRKDFVDRVRDQASLQPRDRTATYSWIPAIFVGVSSDTTPARSPPLHKPPSDFLHSCVGSCIHYTIPMAQEHGSWNRKISIFCTVRANARESAGCVGNAPFVTTAKLKAGDGIRTRHNWLGKSCDRRQ